MSIFYSNEKSGKNCESWLLVALLGWVIPESMGLDKNHFNTGSVITILGTFSHNMLYISKANLLKVIFVTLQYSSQNTWTKS